MQVLSCLAISQQTLIAHTQEKQKGIYKTIDMDNPYFGMITTERLTDQFVIFQQKTTCLFRTFVCRHRNGRFIYRYFSCIIHFRLRNGFRNYNSFRIFLSERMADLLPHPFEKS